MDSRYSRYNPIIPGVLIAPMDNPNNLKTTHKLQLQLCGQNLWTWQQNNPSWASHHNSLSFSSELGAHHCHLAHLAQPLIASQSSSLAVSLVVRGILAAVGLVAPSLNGRWVKRNPWKCEKEGDSHYIPPNQPEGGYVGSRKGFDFVCSWLLLSQKWLRHNIVPWFMMDIYVLLIISET